MDVPNKLRRAAWHLMKQTSIWYDRVPDEHGNPVPGPEYQSVKLLCKMASDIQAEGRTK